jgi:hypothetical protein
MFKDPQEIELEEKNLANYEIDSVKGVKEK